MCLGLVIGSMGKDDYKESVIINYNRMPVCMGDDVYNGIYEIKMPREATVDDSMNIVKSGGNGNDWPVTSGSEWDIYSNIGRIARISPQTEEISYYDKNKDGRFVTAA